MPYLAIQRRNLRDTLIPAINLATGKLEQINVDKPTVATQPDEIEDTLYNTFIQFNNTPYLVQSIDMEDA